RHFTFKTIDICTVDKFNPLIPIDHLIVTVFQLEIVPLYAKTKVPIPSLAQFLASHPVDTDIPASPALHAMHCPFPWHAVVFKIVVYSHVHIKVRTEVWILLLLFGTGLDFDLRFVARVVYNHAPSAHIYPRLGPVLVDFDDFFMAVLVFKFDDSGLAALLIRFEIQLPDNLVD